MVDIALHRINRYQEIIKVRGSISHIGPLTKVITLLLRMLLARCVGVFVEDLFMSFRFVLKQSKTSNTVGMSSLIF